MKPLHRALACALPLALVAPAAAQRGIESAIADARSAAHTEQSWRRTIESGGSSAQPSNEELAREVGARCRADLASDTTEEMSLYFKHTARPAWRNLTLGCLIYQEGAADTRAAVAHRTKP